MLEHEKKIDGQQKGQLNGMGLKGRSIIVDWICMECLSDMKIIVNLWQLPYILVYKSNQKNIDEILSQIMNFWNTLLIIL